MASSWEASPVGLGVVVKELNLDGKDWFFPHHPPLSALPAPSWPSLSPVPGKIKVI